MRGSKNNSVQRQPRARQSFRRESAVRPPKDPLRQRSGALPIFGELTNLTLPATNEDGPATGARTGQHVWDSVSLHMAAPTV
jgi:hypothetical protein